MEDKNGGVYEIPIELKENVVVCDLSCMKLMLAGKNLSRK